MTQQVSKTVLVTGASGNLGGKLVRHLARTGWCDRVVALVEPDQIIEAPGIDVVECDLGGDCMPQLLETLQGIDAVVHLAAQHPYPSATWDDAAASLDMTLKMLDAARTSGVTRFVYASSNHVMGRYKDRAEASIPASLSTQTPPLVGTIVKSPDGSVIDATAYASVRLMGERACAHFTNTPASPLTAVSLRIGWCQQGANQPQTISSTGLPDPDEDAEDLQVAHDTRWFRNMWLSNADFLQVMECGITASTQAWPTRAIVVNAMSNNRAMPWDLEQARALIGFDPKDDVWARN